MEAAKNIRTAVAQVTALRTIERTQPGLKAAVAAIKRIQARRFAGTYLDLMRSGPYAAASRFFLDELYSDKDYSERDAQFARIAGAIERFFPAGVVQTAVGLAQLHALTEELDQVIASAWLTLPQEGSEAARYVTAWRAIGRRDDRERQLAAVIGIGLEMTRLTRTRGLRMMLKVMRGPASAAGLGSLQRFLEAGFDTFAAMARSRAAEDFLSLVQVRENALIEMLFDSPGVAAETELARALRQAL